MRSGCRATWVAPISKAALTGASAGLFGPKKAQGEAEDILLEASELLSCLYSINGEAGIGHAVAALDTRGYGIRSGVLREL